MQALYGSDVEMLMRNSGRRREGAGPWTYRCAHCWNAVFRSRERYPARTLWPVFWAPIGPDRISLRPDALLPAAGSKVFCGRCAAHLGFVLEDGRPPTGLRYFMDPRALLLVGSRSSAEQVRQPGLARTGV
jgi:peptide methionine sulfoxide reductase MsrB